MKAKSIFLAGLVMSAVSTGAWAEKGFTTKDIKKGSYAFSFDGQIITVGPVAATGIMVSDGHGNVTEAVRTISVSGVPATQTFTCTYSVNRNGTGSAVCTVDDGSVETWDLVVENRARTLRFVSTTPGVVALGVVNKQ